MAQSPGFKLINVHKWMPANWSNTVKNSGLKVLHSNVTGCSTENHSENDPNNSLNHRVLLVFHTLHRILWKKIVFTWLYSVPADSFSRCQIVDPNATKQNQFYMTRCLDLTRSLRLILVSQAWRVQTLIKHQTQNEKNRVRESKVWFIGENCW